MRSGPSAEADVLERVQQTIARERLLRAGDRVVLGVSGGPDSVVLLHLFLRLRSSRQLRMRVVHVDHRLRADSADDARHVAQLATQWQVPVEVVERDVQSECAAQGWSLEEGARRIRYEVLRQVATRHSAHRIVVAHTADDQAETVLMRLLRGAGLTGLSGMPCARPLGSSTLIRPLLQVWREEILAYAASHCVSFRHDASNTDPRFLRNRLRAQLLPLLEQSYNPNIKALLAQLANQCRTDLEFVQSLAQRQWKRMAKFRHGEWVVRLASFRRQPEALKRQLIRVAISSFSDEGYAMEFRHWLEIASLVTDRPVGTVVDLPGGLQVERGADTLIVRRLASRSAGASVLDDGFSSTGSPSSRILTAHLSPMTNAREFP